jgi:hypothetical protein
MRSIKAAVCLVAALLSPLPARASDHADPIWLSEADQEANITGLFFFPDGDRMIAILNVRRALTGPPPYRLSPWEYHIRMDTHSHVVFEDDTATGADKQLYDGNLARYGGTVPNPGQIEANIDFHITLNDDTSFRTLSITGLSDNGQAPLEVCNNCVTGLDDIKDHPEKYKDRIIAYSGVRDDPFIFPKFFNVNVISMVFSIPKSYFLGAETWLLWATSNRASDHSQIDHVGRSNRTQLARYDILNTLPPDQHVAKLREAAAARSAQQQFLKDVIPPLANLNQLSGLLLRNYDFAPDVMIYSSKRPPAFPNGRQLKDDVAYLTCQTGDCPLQENSFIDSSAYPRATKNDKEFLAEFPYLAEPWPFRPQQPAGSIWPYIYKYIALPLGAAVILIAFFFWLRRRVCATLATK